MNYEIFLNIIITRETGSVINVMQNKAKIK